MAAYDIQVYSTTDECASRIAFRTNISAATFQIGEPVIILANELADGETGPGGVDPVTIDGIACEPAVSRGSRMAALEIEDTLRLIELPSTSKVFMARYFAINGAGTVVAPTYATVAGIPGNLVHNGTNWTFDTGAGNINCVGLDVLDQHGRRLGDDLVPHGTATSVLFAFI